MGAATAILVGAFALVALQPTDADANARARARVLSVLPTATPVATEQPAPRGILGPSVLAQRALSPVLPPLLTLPADVATPLPSDSAVATREVKLATSRTSEPTVYRLPDGRLFVVQRTLSDRGRPALVNWFEETAVRGHPAQMYSAAVGPFRALLWWTEGTVSYYLYSGSLTTRDLVRVAGELR